MNHKRIMKVAVGAKILSDATAQGKVPTEVDDEIFLEKNKSEE